MFGYVKPRRAELRIKEFEYYRCVYCGLCHAEKKLSRRLRLLLSYDMAALALLRIGTAEESSVLVKKRCPRHPFGGRYCVGESSALSFTASAAAILLTYKLLDDIADEKGRKRLTARMLLGGARRAMRASLLPELEDFVREKLEELAALEKEQSGGLYGGAEIFGSLLGGLFAFDGSNLPPLTREQKICLREIGYRVGRFIYILDAYADRDEDRKNGKYNPFLLPFSQEAGISERVASESGEDGRSVGGDFSEKTLPGGPFSQPPDGGAEAASLLTALDMECDCALRALDLLTLSDPGIESILRNLFGMGLHDAAEEVIQKERDKKLPRKRTDGEKGAAAAKPGKTDGATDGVDSYRERENAAKTVSKKYKPR